jgi:putative endonuclease
MTFDRQELGDMGELAAARRAAEAGYEILEKNYRFKGDAEADLVCRLDDVLIFVEVRTTSTDYLESPALSVDRRKQGQVVRAARLFMKEQRMGDYYVRFDVAAVKVNQEGEASVDWIEDAFRPPSTATCGKMV